MVKIWCKDFSELTYVEGTIQEPKRLLGLSLTAAKPLRATFPKDLTIGIKSKSAPSDYFTVGPLPIISEQLRQLLVDHDVTAEFFEVALANHRNAALGTRWYVLNVLRDIDCLDWEASQYICEKDLATQIEQLVLRADVCIASAEPLFRVARTIPSILCVQDEVAADMVNAGCTGVTFKSPAGWRNPTNQSTGR